METVSYTPPKTLLSPLRSCVVLVDYQENLMPAMAEQEMVIKEAVRLSKIANSLHIPVIATEQNPSRLGSTVTAIASCDHTRLEKTHFDACAFEGLLDALPVGCSQIVIAGCEAHICLLQTVLGLLQQNYDVFVVAEACGSRRLTDKIRGLARLEKAGAILISVEMAGFEWMQSYQHPRFKEVLELIKPL